MKVEIWSIGITKEKYLKEGQEIYLKRLKHYCQLKWIEYKEPKSSSRSVIEIKKIQSEFLLDKIDSNDMVVLLDERGELLSSTGFSKRIQAWQNKGVRRLIFIIGGAFGFSQSLYKRANFQMSLSKMTFTHLMIRTFFLEQLYRAFSILKGEKYHNE